MFRCTSLKKKRKCESYILEKNKGKETKILNKYILKERKREAKDEETCTTQTRARSI